MSKTRERKSKKELETLFDKQWLKLKRRGCPEQILEIFQNQKTEFILTASEISFAKGNLRLLLIVPRTHLTAYTQMSMLKNSNYRGYVRFLCPTDIFEVVESPLKPYYLLNVEDGSATLGKSPEEAENLIKRQKCLPLTEVEIIHLAIQSDVLSHHFLDATACRCFDESKVPFLALDEKGRPVLSWYRYKSGHHRWGSPFCAKRLSLF